MKNDILNRGKGLFLSIKSKYDRTNIITFIICLGFALGLWFLNALSKEYTVTISYPVKYINLPKDKLLINTPAPNLNITVSSGGFAILHQKLSMVFTSLVVDGNNFPSYILEADSSIRYAAPTDKLKEYLAEQINNELTVTNIYPDSISFNLEQLVEKKFAIKANINYTLLKQHYLSSDITFKPDSVLVLGPKSVLDTLTCVYTQHQSYKDLRQNIQRNLNLENILNCSFDTKRAVMNIQIEEFTEKQFDIPINIINVPDSVDVKLFPSKVKLYFQVGLSQFSEVNEEDFNVFVDFKNMSSSNELLEVQHISYATKLQSISTTPKRVEYLIQKKEQE